MIAQARMAFAVCLTVLAFASVAGADLVAEESFVYDADSALDGLNGGTGWAGAWTAVDSSSSFPQQILAGNLDDYAGLVNSGNHLGLWSAGNGSKYQQAYRSFGTSYTADGTYWLGFQIASNDAKTGPSKFYLTSDGSGDEFLRFDSEPDADIKTHSGTVLVSGDDNYTPHLILLKIELSSSADESLTYYVDPDLSADPTGGITSTASFSSGLTGFKWDGPRASASMDCDFYMDELRLATTWQEAVGQGGGPTPGDINNDNVVDAADYIILKEHFGMTSGTTHDMGDIDGSGDGMVNLLDLQALVTAMSSSGDTAVPEPATLGLLAMGAIAVLRRRRNA